MRSSIAVAILAGTSAAACGLDSAGTLASSDGGSEPDTSMHDDGGTSNDAGNEASDAKPNGCPEIAISCDGVCVTSCAGCDAGTAICTVTRECGHCDKCPGFELECFACANGSGPPTPFCGTPSGKCGISHDNHCPCTIGDPMSCPGQSQACVPSKSDPDAGTCLTCGEDDSDKVTCKNGLVCDESAKPPSCSQS